MRLSLTVVDPLVGDRADVLVDADGDVRTGALAAELALLFREAAPVPAASGGKVLRLPTGASRAAAGEPDLYVGGVLLDPEQPLAGAGLKEGAVVTLGEPGDDRSVEPLGVVEVRVVSGPGAGVVHRLGVGTARIGSSDDGAVRLDSAAPACVATVDVDPEGAVVLTAVDDAATLEGAAVPPGAVWQPGEQLACGGVLLELRLPTPADAALQPSEDGTGFDYNRPPRLLPPPRETSFKLPLAPREMDRRPIPIAITFLPVLGGVGFALMTGNFYFLAIAFLSPIAMLANYWSDRRHGRTSFKKQVAEYEARKAAIEQDAEDALLLERAARRADCPDPAALMLVAVGPRHQLWERRRHDPDHLLLRFGTRDQPSEVMLEDPALEEHKRKVARIAGDVPVTVPLASRGVVGIAGRPEVHRRLGAWAVGQIAVLHSPSDVQLYVLAGSDNASAWEWTRWLPHVRPAEGQDALALLGTDQDSMARRVGELAAMVGARKRALKDHSSGSVTLRQPDVVVVLDGARRLRSLPGVIQVLRDGPEVGVYTICLDADQRLLPEECQAVVVETAHGVRVQQMRTDVLDDVRPDLVAPGWCERISRALAPVRDVGGEDDEAVLPSSSRLLDVLGLEPPTPDAVASRWLAGGRTTAAVVGESTEGPFVIDLVRDGPHGLIAGTTGAGKSELLQTLVASLAAANRPDAMTFVLVDYKGGSAFKDCVLLPHTVGMVTDLDTHLVERALESLGAELRRREHILAGAGAKDIEDYTILSDADPSLAPMPRLVLVIDEFASMARELPDFVTGLVNIAQRGRSLGIHLLLATQRPSGVVSPEIRANTNLRIALRVTDASESTDVIDARDAARISKSTPGRAYVRLGATSLVPFQSGRVGGRRPGAVAVDVRPWVVEVGWQQLGRPVPNRPVVRGDDDEITDLTVLVQAIRGANEQLGLPAQHSPWLPALTTEVMLADLPAPAASGALAPVPFALEDLPAAQERRTAALDLETFGHLLAAGTPRSGRSQLLRTIAGSIASTHSSADVHLYGIDCGNGALLPLADLPHCGAVVTRTQVERASRLITRLSAEVGRRQDVLAEGGFADLSEQRAAAAPDQRLPHIVVLLDRWEGFTTTLGEIDGGRLMDELMVLMREGSSAGVHLVVVGDRTLLSGRISTMTEDKLAFRLADRSDFSLMGLNPRKMPDDMPAGRAFRSETGVETQVALLARDTSSAGQAAALQEIAQAARVRDAAVPRSLRPFRVDVLPSRLTFADAWKLYEAAPNPLWGLVGVGGDELAPYGVDLADGVSTFVVAGPPKSGRSTVLLTMTRSFLNGGAQVVVVTPRLSPLRELDGVPGVARLFTGDELKSDELSETIEGIDGPLVVVMDDAELLRDCDAADVLRGIVRSGVDTGRGLVIGGNAEDICGGFSGWQIDVKKGRRGALLSPQGLSDGDLIGVRVPRSILGQPVAPGRAFVHLGDGDPFTVQVPATTPA